MSRLKYLRGHRYYIQFSSLSRCSILQSHRIEAQIVLANRQELVLSIEDQQHQDHYEPVQYVIAS
jgi:hypothetical protein